MTPTITARNWAWSRLLRTLGVGVIVIVAISAIDAFGPPVEQRFFPSASGPVEIVQRVSNPDGSVSIRFAVTRNFECRRIDSQWYVDRGNGWVPVHNVQVSGLPTVRPAGRNISPINTFPATGLYLLVVSMDCGWPWTSLVKLGPFNLT